MKRLFLFLSFILIFLFTLEAQKKLPNLKISENKRFIETDNHLPFFYLGDTAWELFHRLNKEEADLYLETRAKQGYNVVQCVALAECDGLNTPNSYGFLPFIDYNPSKPDIKEGLNNDYWDHVDYIIEKANSLGIYIGFLPTLGMYWNDGTPLFNETDSR